MAVQIEREYDYRKSGSQLSLLPEPRRLWMIFLRRKWIFLAAVILVLTAVAAAVFFATPRFAATASVLIEPQRSKLIDIGSVAQGLPADTNAVDTQVQIITSPTVGLRVVRALNMDRMAEYARAPASAAVPVTKQAATPAEKAALATVLNSVSVRRAGLTYVIDISASSKDPVMAANIANSFAREYLALQLDRRKAVVQNAADLVSGRTAELARQVDADNAAVQRYMIANNLMSAEGSTNAEQEVSALNQQIAETRARVAEARGRMAAARGQIGRGGGGDNVGAVLTSDTIKALRDREAQSSGNLAQLQAQYGEKYPDVVKAKEEVADIRRKIANESGRIVAALGADVAAAESKLHSLEASQASARAGLAANSQAQAGLAQLKLKADASTAIYNAVLQGAKETSEETALPQADASITSLARVPDLPIWPNYKLASVFGVGLALIFGLLAIALAEYLDGTIRTKDDVERKLGVRYVGAVADLESTLAKGQAPELPHNYVVTHPFSMFVESLRGISSTALRKGEVKVMVITSALPREGKTTTSIGIARTLAAGKKVVLVDGDLRRHSASDILAPDSDERLLRYLVGKISLEEALVKDSGTDLYILPTSGQKMPDEYLSPERVARLYAELRAHFDVVVVDAPPLLGVAEARVLSSLADTTVVVCRWRKAQVAEVQGAIDILDQADAKVAGVALSRVDIRQYAGTGLGDAFGYNRKFTGYYVN